MDPIYLTKLISGSDRRGSVRLLRVLLRAASACYSVVIAFLNWLYDKHILKSTRVAVPVICVGNITTGGTGKTPLVAWLCRLLAQKGISAAVLTRGYKTQDDKLSDEPALLAKGCPGAKIIVNPNRIAGAKKAITNYNVEVCVMDDGFQHRRLARDLDIIAIDATEPFGYGRLLPAGLLREPVKSLSRADAVVITRYNQTAPERIDEIENTINAIKPDMPIAKAIHKPVCLRMKKGTELPVEEIAGKKVLAFCGIGNPEAFYSTLRQIGAIVVDTKTFNDHYFYTADDVSQICDAGRLLEVDMIISTQKDWVKTTLFSHEKYDGIFACLIVELEFIDKGDKIISLIEKTTGNIE